MVFGGGGVPDTQSSIGKTKHTDSALPAAVYMTNTTPRKTLLRYGMPERLRVGSIHQYRAPKGITKHLPCLGPEKQEARREERR